VVFFFLKKKYVYAMMKGLKFHVLYMM